VNSIHLWTPELFALPGGIQSFSRTFLAALNRALPFDEIRVQLKNDLPAALPPSGKFAAYGHYSPRLRNLRFAAGCFLRAYRERPRVVIAGHPNFGPLARLIKQSTNIPNILLAYGIDAWHVRSPARRRALQEADLILSISRYTRDCLIEIIGVDARRVKLLAPTFCAEHFNLAPKPAKLLQKHDLSADTPVILTVCRLAEAERYKGYDQIIKALPQILRVLPQARYLLVGTGPDRPRVEKLIRDAGVSRAVTLVGAVSDDELAGYYNLCDVFAMPSKAEGFGIVYLEALACGKPVLAGNRDGSRDALADGELGLLVDADDIDEIAGELIGVLRREHSHPNIFQAKLLRRRARELFGVERFQQTVAERLQPFLDR
jgi:phosphatidylinositol alpha-1,6-mannosyltransferase